MSIKRNDNGVSVEMREDFRLWVWEDVDNEVTVKIPIPTEVIEEISTNAAKTVLDQISEDCRIEIAFGPDDAFVEVYLFDNSEEDSALRCDMTTMINDWIVIHGGSNTEKIESDDVAGAWRLIELLEQAVVRLRAAIPD